MQIVQFRDEATSFAERRAAELIAGSIENANYLLATEIREYRNEGFFVMVYYTPSGMIEGWAKL